MNTLRMLREVTDQTQAELAEAAHEATIHEPTIYEPTIYEPTMYDMRPCR